MLLDVETRTGGEEEKRNIEDSAAVAIGKGGGSRDGNRAPPHPPTLFFIHNDCIFD